MDRHGLSGLERLTHILEAISRIQMYCEGIDEAEFLRNDMVQSAVLYEFIIIGEAVSYVDPELLKKYPYPWHLPRSFRNYIAHEYFGINLSQVYGTVVRVLPDFEKLLRKMIDQESYL